MFHYSTGGKAVILNLAAPMGIKVMSSNAPVAIAGYAGSTAHKPNESISHEVILRPLALISMGTFSTVNGKLS